MNWIKCSLAVLLLSAFCSSQISSGTGYTVPKTGFGLSLVLGPGNCSTGAGVTVSYVGALITLSSNTTSYGYLNSSCVLTTNTTGFPSSSIPIFTAITGVTDITSITDSRTTYNFAGGGASVAPGSPTSSVQFNGAGVFTGDANLLWDNTNKDLLIGSTSSTGSSSTLLELHSATSANERIFTHSSAGGGFSAITMERSQGTQGSPTAVSLAESLGEVAFFGYDGSNYINAANIAGFSSQAFSVGTTPGNLQFTILLSPNTPTEAFRMGGGPSFNLNVSELDTGVLSGNVLGFNSGAVGTSIDTALSRDSAGVMDLGNGTAANKSGSLNLTTLTTSGEVHVYPSATTGTLRLGSDGNVFLNRSGSNIVFNGGLTGITAITSAQYVTTTNCAAVGTAANPSVASCTAAPAGSFSCATNASGGTCTVNTTIVTTGSQIFITQRTDTTTGTRLGVTCNTAVSTVLPVITAVTNVTSFTINLGTINTNPECFSYFIIN